MSSNPPSGESPSGQSPGRPPILPKDRFSKEVTLTPEDAAAFARAAGDLNPLHHDPVHAAKTRFEVPIASGTQTSSLLLGVVATHFSKYGAMLGLDFRFRFNRAVRADETIRLEWMVVSVRPSLAGELVDLRGRLLNEAGQTAIGATGRVLVTESL